MPRSDTPTSTRERQAVQLRHTHRVRTVPRPLVGGGGSFELSYTRTGPVSATPLLVFPGGPGLGSVLPYAGLRRRAERMGLDVIMIEHRGVGLSRTSANGNDIARSEIRFTEVLADAAAVLDAERVERAIPYGTSYGSTVALGFGARHPNRVAAMVLDSAMLGASSEPAASRALHDLYWDALVPSTHALALRVRALADRGMLQNPSAGFVFQLLHEFGGPPFVARYLSLLEQDRGRNFSAWAIRIGKAELSRVVPFHMEFDLVGEIAFRELDYGGTSGTGRTGRTGRSGPAQVPDPLDLSGQFDALSRSFSAFEAPGVDFADALPSFRWPTVVISGERDIRTPRSVSERIVTRVPGAVLFPVPGHGHSALDTQQSLALRVMHAVATGLRDPGGISARLPSEARGTPGVVGRMLALRIAAAALPFAR